MAFYKLRKDDIAGRDTGFYSSYGIDVFDESSVQPIRSIKDISLKKEGLDYLVSLCNDLQLETIHLDDIVEDFLAF